MDASEQFCHSGPGVGEVEIVDLLNDNRIDIVRDKSMALRPATLLW
jgi:hypothetical protein